MVQDRFQRNAKEQSIRYILNKQQHTGIMQTQEPFKRDAKIKNEQ
jgi:hypothetical protein